MPKFEPRGGNAANTAHTMALLAMAQAFHHVISKQKQNDENNNAVPETAAAATSSPSVVIVRLCSKVGDDDIGNKVVGDLQKAGVDLSCPLFQVANGATTGLTTIIVSEMPEHTRTCLYTPGSCGELSLAEAKQLLQLSSHDHDGDEDNDDKEHDDRMIMNQLFDNVVHFHADARHTDVAMFLARQAARRGISVSVDVEKDRGTAALDQLLKLANIVFTNNGPAVQDYFHRMARDKRQEDEAHQRPPTPEPALSLHLPTTTDPEGEVLREEEMKTFASALGPSMFFTRWLNQVGKQVIVTQGSRGAMHIVCESIIEEAETKSIDVQASKSKSESEVVNATTVNKLEMISSSQQQQQQQHGQKSRIQRHRRLQHTFSSSSRQSSSSSSSSTTLTKVATYSIHTTGVLQDIKKVVDTTGAGDAFIGAFLLFRIVAMQQQWQQEQHDDDDDNNNTLNCMMQKQQYQYPNYCPALDFAAWVAGCKVQGPGARMALPTARDVDEMLGTSLLEIQESLEYLIGPFQFETERSE
jgi:sugar/nucleoside kinase (ribokinase family)